MAGQQPLGQYLLKHGHITKEQLDIALAEFAITKEKLGQIMIHYGFITRQVLTQALSDTNPLALVGENNFEINIPPRVLLDTQSIIIGDSGKDFYFATLNPDAESVIETMRKYLGDTRTIHLKSIEYNAIQEHLQRLRKSVELDIADIRGDINDIIKKLIEDALDDGASDIHIEPTEKTLIVRCRVDGILSVSQVLSKEFESRMFSRLKDMASMDISEKHLPQDGSFSLEYRSRKIDFRMATLPSVDGEKITIRVLDKEKVLLDLSQTGLTCINEWSNLATLPNGIILVCGPTGSGKTTTLYSTTKLLDTLHKAVYMIEDPSEYAIPWVTQVQVNRRAGLGFPEFIRTVLRHDPDIVIVGEIRDKETADIALRLADTGHLVYATLHTNDVPSSITRLKNLGVDLGELSFLLRGVLVQRLFRVLCPQCKGAKAVKSQDPDGEDEPCTVCKATGYRGRSLLTEFASIENERDVEQILAMTKEFHTFERDATMKISSGITDLREMRRVNGVNFNPIRM